MAETDTTRLRSFAERYVIERASTFRTGECELEDAHAATQRAMTIYKMIDDVAQVRIANWKNQNEELPDATGPVGVTRAVGPNGPGYRRGKLAAPAAPVNSKSWTGV